MRGQLAVTARATDDYMPVREGRGVLLNTKRRIPLLYPNRAHNL